jgi:hypothetical protein
MKEEEYLMNNKLKVFLMNLIYNKKLLLLKSNVKTLKDLDLLD